LLRNAGKKVVVVQGLGFVGAVMSLVCANSLTEEYAVIGIDLPTENSFWKIQSINDGVFPLIADDPKIDSFFEQSKAKGNFYATYDPIAFSYADVIIVDINLDVQKTSFNDYSLDNFEVDLTGFKSAISSIGMNLSGETLVLVETTVPPGTTENIVKPILENKLKERGELLSNLKLGHSYERVMPGPEYIDSIREFPRVYAGVDDVSANAILNFLNTIIDTEKCDLTKLQHTNASEIAKVLENSYRAMNIAFAVEWSRFSEEAGVDMYAIVDAIRKRKTHANLMYPGVGVGGYCLTKDPLLASWARKSFFNSQSDLEMSISSVSKNDQMPSYAFNRLVEVFGDLANKKVAFLGISYRGDVGDTRYTPVKHLLDLVKKHKAMALLHDPYIQYWEEQSCKVENNIDVILKKNPEIIIISTGHSLYKNDEILSKLMLINPCKIFDTVGIFSESQLIELNEKHIVSVLGRGDI
jgi:nucleotide sugar dehydrogenase